MRTRIHYSNFETELSHPSLGASHVYPTHLSVCTHTQTHTSQTPRASADTTSQTVQSLRAQKKKKKKKKVGRPSELGDCSAGRLRPPKDYTEPKGKQQRVEELKFSKVKRCFTRNVNVCVRVMFTRDRT